MSVAVVPEASEAPEQALRARARVAMVARAGTMRRVVFIGNLGNRCANGKERGTSWTPCNRGDVSVRLAEGKSVVAPPWLPQPGAFEADTLFRFPAFPGNMPVI
ncbi:hypothetical protein GCM10023081_43760 [Arthrobacter ginkgonis]|uniref:Uncharacterized protein n=1 Tax=Arthrobacter ginkgonis TaxID=1630594 RepID=A0ABP7DDC3_9MICC